MQYTYLFVVNSKLCTLSECPYSNKNWIVKSKYTPRFFWLLLTYHLILLLNKQRLNHRKLLLRHIDYHRRSEFTEKISHRLNIFMQAFSARSWLFFISISIGSSRISIKEFSILLTIYILTTF